MKAAITIVVVVAAGLLMAWCTSQLVRPWLFLPTDRIVALVSEGCGISQNVVMSAVASEEVRRALVVVPVDSEDTPGRTEACALAISAIRERAPWFTLFSEPWLCEQLVRDAARYHHVTFTGVPGYMMNGAPVSADRVSVELSRKGLVFNHGLILRQALIDEMKGTIPRDNEKVGDLRTVYGQDIGF